MWTLDRLENSFVQERVATLKQQMAALTEQVATTKRQISALVAVKERGTHIQRRASCSACRLPWHFRRS